VARVFAGPDIVFVSVPGADDVRILGVVLQGPHRAVARHRLDDALENTALAYRTAAMGAFVVPGMKLAVDQENSDLGLAASDQKAAALSQFVEPAGMILRHEAPRLPSCRR
jgi:hypothetical protein